ncbi:C4-dicarboxylate ABC transporter permease [Marinobacterium aestuarii]|uniref:TRAP transporter small permease protein n=1 Tax=Marinobacterium aestuarii TaxID=1821621 RepID=A0A1A9F3H2_9GAMM|nr:TRAP transporter small permease subunit [Marinobacterium aestuarii]ANG64757.1 C4-dicarboxylate ABC transporter permease [Marinobacterium aestuarii]
MNDNTSPSAESQTQSALPVTEQETTGMDRLVDKAGKLAAWLVLIAMLISVFEVISRYIFNAPTTWVHETTIFLVASIFAIGGPYALARNRHIQIRIVLDLLSPQKRRWLEVLNLVLGIGFCVAIGYAAWVLAHGATHTPTGDWRLETSGSSWNSPLPAFTKIVILLSVVLMALQLIVRLCGYFKNKK